MTSCLPFVRAGQGGRVSNSKPFSLSLSKETADMLRTGLSKPVMSQSNQVPGISLAPIASHYPLPNAQCPVPIYYFFKFTFSVFVCVPLTKLCAFPTNEIVPPPNVWLSLHPCLLSSTE